MLQRSLVTMSLLARSIKWSAQTLHGANVTFQLRSAESHHALKEARWNGPGGAESWYDRSGAAIEPLPGLWIQYRARLQTPNGGPTPYLTSVTVQYE